MSHIDARAQPLPGALLSWYDRHRRALPWRAAPGERPVPYHVWLSEIMLQQTTVAAVGPYFERFVKRWPSVAALADTPQEDVLAEWAGLGYYARARNLHACAKAVVLRGGSFPDTEEELRSLPGVGPYTAAAIAAIAFDRVAAAVDGNVERVIARIFTLTEPLPAAKQRIRDLTRALVPFDRPGDFAQALMDLGATVCTPKRPACGLCPWLGACLGRKAGIAEGLPAKPRKGERPTRRGAAFWVERPDGAILLTRRAERGLLGGMTGLWTTPLTSDIADRAALEFAPLEADWRRLPGEVEHVFTHFRLRLTVYAAYGVMAPAPAGAWWLRADRMAGAGLPTLMRKAVAHARQLHDDGAACPDSIRPRRRARRARPV